jgi:hypothetical protein
VADDLVRQILEALNREVVNQLDLARAIAHPGESGHAREQIIAAFFRRLLPGSFGLSTGFVIDASGSISRQIDLVIYRTDYHPVFEIGGVKHFLAEGVEVVMEVKASIADRGTLHEALDNIKSVKRLDRTNRGKNYTLVGSQRGPAVDPNEFQHQIFGAIVTEASLGRETLEEELLAFLRSNPKTCWPNFYADIRHLSASYGKVGAAELTVVPDQAECLAMTDNASPNFVPPIVELAMEVANFLRVAPLIDYSAADYLLSKSGKVDWWKI